MSVFTGLADALHRREAEEFAAMLESRRVPAGHELADLVALTRALAPAEHAPRPEFRAALRERLVTEAADRVPATVPPPRRTEPAGPTGRRRLRTAVASVTLAAVVTGAGAAAASTRALPGDVLYGLKRQIEDVQLALAGSDLGRGRELLEQAETRLSEAERLAASSGASEPGTQRGLSTALAEMDRATAAGASALTESYRETGDEEPMLLLDRFVVDQQERLQDLMVLLDPSLRARVRATLDELERLESMASALVASTTTTTRSLVLTARESGDGWAVSRVADQIVAAGDSGGADATELAGTGGLTSTAGGTGSTTTSGGGLLDDLADSVTSGSTSGGGTSGDSGDLTGGLVGGSTTSAPDLGTGTSPLPTLSPEPLPTASPLPTLEPTLDPSTVTSPLPLPSTSACVPLPPLTTC